MSEGTDRKRKRSVAESSPSSKKKNKKSPVPGREDAGELFSDCITVSNTTNQGQTKGKRAGEISISDPSTSECTLIKVTDGKTPSEGTQAKVTAGKTPSEGTQAKVTAGKTPSEGTQAKVTAGKTPSEGTQAKVTAGKTPSEGTQAKVTAGKTPSEKTRPADGNSSRGKSTTPPDEQPEFEFFFGKKSPFSQHHPATFSVREVSYCCAEQYMMHQKAVLFKDAAMATQIMGTEDPVRMKKLGRKVRNFSKDRWATRSLEVVKEASLAKFSQNAALLKALLGTWPRDLVEAAPRDRLWGIGLGASNPKARDRTQWRGRNLLGTILTQVRQELRARKEDEKAD